jgi:hypothetical protein
VKAFITGSYAYGTPREDSDVDLCICCDAETIAQLCHLVGTNDGDGSAEGSVKIGKLDLIMLSPEYFEAWRTATEELKARAPVTRAEAMRTIEEHKKRVTGDTP